MNLILEQLRTSALPHMEFGQLMRRHQSDLSTIEPALCTDAPYNNYVQKITAHTGLYEKALAQVRKNEETEKIVLADRNRDKSVAAFNAGINLYSLSDVSEEVEASRVLGILFGTYKNLAKQSYEAQTLGMDKLTAELSSPTYSPKVSLLQMDRYVARMANTNAAFKNLFGGRMVTTANSEIYDMKAIRAELQDMYNDFADYLLSMSKAIDNPLFPKALTLLNTARKYYADLLARRTAPKAGEVKPSVN